MTTALNIKSELEPNGFNQTICVLELPIQSPAPCPIKQDLKIDVPPRWSLCSMTELKQLFKEEGGGVRSRKLVETKSQDNHSNQR